MTGVENSINLIEREGVRRGKEFEAQLCGRSNKSLLDEENIKSMIANKLNAKWINTLFCNAKFVNKYLLSSEEEGSIMQKAFDVCGWDTVEQKAATRILIKDHIKEKINRCRHFFVENIKRSIVDDKGCGKGAR